MTYPKINKFLKYQGHTVLYTDTLYQVGRCIQFRRYIQDKILKVKVTTAKSKVKSRSHHDIAHLHPLANVPSMYQLPRPYSFRDIAWTDFKVKVTTARFKVKSINPPTMFLASINKYPTMSCVKTISPSHVELNADLGWPQAIGQHPRKIDILC